MFSKFCKTKGNARDGSVCFEGVTSITPVYVVVNWPFQSGQGCFPDILGSQVSVCFSSLCTHAKGFSETTSGSVSNAYNDPSKDRPTCNLLVIRSSLQVVAWTISGRTYLQMEYQRGLATL